MSFVGGLFGDVLQKSPLSSTGGAANNNVIDWKAVNPFQSVQDMGAWGAIAPTASTPPVAATAPLSEYEQWIKDQSTSKYTAADGSRDTGGGYGGFDDIGNDNPANYGTTSGTTGIGVGRATDAINSAAMANGGRAALGGLLSGPIGMATAGFNGYNDTRNNAFSGILDSVNQQPDPIAALNAIQGWTSTPSPEQTAAEAAARAAAAYEANAMAEMGYGSNSNDRSPSDYSGGYGLSGGGGNDAYGI